MLLEGKITLLYVPQGTSERSSEKACNHLAGKQRQAISLKACDCLRLMEVLGTMIQGLDKHFFGHGQLA